MTVAALTARWIHSLLAGKASGLFPFALQLLVAIIVTAARDPNPVHCRQSGGEARWLRLLPTFPCAGESRLSSAESLPSMLVCVFKRSRDDEAAHSHTLDLATEASLRIIVDAPTLLSGAPNYPHPKPYAASPVFRLYWDGISRDVNSRFLHWLPPCMSRTVSPAALLLASALNFCSISGGQLKWGSPEPGRTDPLVPTLCPLCIFHDARFRDPVAMDAVTLFEGPRHPLPPGAFNLTRALFTAWSDPNDELRRLWNPDLDSASKAPLTPVLVTAAFVAAVVLMSAYWYRQVRRHISRLPSHL